MTAAIEHRGPDADGAWSDEVSGLALGHRRLSIVDLSATGAQPMHSSSGRWVVTFNGEIYNYQELRRELAGGDRKWRGTSDTEVLLEAIEEWGLASSLERIAGMYALGLWDRRDRTLHLVRDRVGEKPLYAGQVDGAFLFGSELKALIAHPLMRSHVRPEAVASVLQHGYVLGDHSIYEGIERVAPGGHVQVRRDGDQFTLDRRRYWSVHNVLERSPQQFASLDAATDAFEATLADVVKSEMVADVPVGAFLSGGIDSSLIVATMRRVSSGKIRTFTVSFDDSAFDEASYARAVAERLETEHTELRLYADDLLAIVDRLPEIYDEPFADSSQLPTLLVSRETRRHVTVALSGDGGDELFGGYTQYTTPDSIGGLVSRVPRSSRRILRSLVEHAPPPAIARAFRGRSSWSENARARLAMGLSGADDRSMYEALIARWANPAWPMAQGMREQLEDGWLRQRPDWPRRGSMPERRMAYDFQTYLPDDVMTKVDRAAMAVSLESRAPLLHHRLVEFAFSLPLQYKIYGSTGKLVLRHALSRQLPASLFERPKQGFAIPIASWLRTRLRAWAEAQLEADEVMRTWFDRARVRRLWHAHQAGGEDHAARLWPILIVLQWLRRTRATPTGGR